MPEAAVPRFALQTGPVITNREFDMHKMLAAWAMGLCAVGAQAQTALDDRSGEATLACLQRPAAPKYPEKELEQRTGGFYRLLLSFTDAAREPEVKVLFNAGSEDLQLAAERYARQFRLPCLKAEHTVALLQEVRFTAVADGGVEAPRPLNLPRTANQRYGECTRTPPDGPRLHEPSQLQAFKRELKNANLVAQLDFTAPDQPPQVKVVYDTLNSRHRNDILDHLAEYRVPCLDAGASYKTQQIFHVGFEGNRRFAFKDVGLVKFLGMVKNLDARPVNFELDTMACPFRVRYTLGRPALRNQITESGDRNPNRRAFIAWLEELELDLTREQFENLLGAEVFIDVPCGTVKLG
jgi:hypothetical protein